MNFLKTTVLLAALTGLLVAIGSDHKASKVQEPKKPAAKAQRAKRAKQPARVGSMLAQTRKVASAWLPRALDVLSNASQLLALPYGDLDLAGAALELAYQPLALHFAGPLQAQPLATAPNSNC